ncbi:MAG: cytochrome c3 family protein [Planctomycetota bacterium]
MKRKPTMPASVRVTILVVALGFVLVSLGTRVSALRLPGNNQGYSPVQPIAYSHRLHAGELQIPCLYCHFGARESRNAGIPPANVCMNCHRFVTATLGAVREEDELAKKEEREPRRIVSPELEKLYEHLGLGEDLQPDPSKPVEPIRWIRIHRLPDFVRFDHRPHVAAEVTCQECHGPVEGMERVRQENDLTMGWCVNCHRRVNRDGVGGRKVAASVDCGACHF